VGDRFAQRPGGGGHGALEQITIKVAGSVVSIAPIVEGVGAIAIGENLRDFAAAVGTQVLETSGATIELDGAALHVRFPAG
jgi:hypothetical protein